MHHVLQTNLFEDGLNFIYIFFVVAVLFARCNIHCVYKDEGFTRMQAPTYQPVTASL